MSWPDMIDDDGLNALWMRASRRAEQPQCSYPQADTLREFARAMWREGFTDGQAEVPEGTLIPCPY